MPNIDEPMRFDDDKTCQRCGYAKYYHEMTIDGKIYIPCIRKKPYKLADGVDVKLGMQIWNFHPYSNDLKIKTGMVRFIRSWGGLCIWKYPEDRDPNRIFDLAHEGQLTASFSCFSSLENAQAAVEKRKKEIAKLEEIEKKYKEKHKISL